MRKGIPERMVFRASDFQAVLGLESLSAIQGRIERHRAIAARYRHALAGHGILPRSTPKAESSHLRFPVLLPSGEAADRMLARLRKRKVFAERSGLSVLDSGASRAMAAMDRMLLLPCHAGLTDADLEGVLARIGGPDA